MSQSDQEFCFILEMKRAMPTCQGMSISPLPTSQIRCSRMPVMHSLAALIQASPVSPCILKCISPISLTCLACVFPGLVCPVHLFLPLRRCQQQLLLLIRLLKSEAGGRTHLLVPAGPPVQEGAGCLSSCSGP